MLSPSVPMAMIGFRSPPELRVMRRGHHPVAFLRIVNPLALVLGEGRLYQGALPVPLSFAPLPIVLITVCIRTLSAALLSIKGPLAVVSTSVPVPNPVAPHTSADTMPLPPLPLALVPARMSLRVTATESIQRVQLAASFMSQNLLPLTKDMVPRP